MVKVFVSYAHADGELQKELNEHLGALRHEHIIETWHDGQIVPGNTWSEDIARHLIEADLILLLVSSAFLNSTYCYEKEMKCAIERHNAGTARLIPIILRPCHWKPAPFAKLQGLPEGMIPVTNWPRRKRDVVWADVAKGIHLAALSCMDQRAEVRRPTGEAEVRELAKVQARRSVGETISNYDFDVYVSYIHSDAAPRSVNSEEGVSAIVIDLSHALARQLGRRVAFSNWGDGPLLPGQFDNPMKNLTNLVERSALLLAFLSVGYINSSWCQAERQIFIDSHRDALATRQLFVIETVPQRGNFELSAFRNLLKYRFYKIDENGDTLRFAPPRNSTEQTEYFKVINALASDMAKHLRDADEGLKGLW
jgi:TIR domain